MQPKTYYVRADWDEEAEVWYVSQSDVPGLVAEAETSEKLIALLNELIPELLELNGTEAGSEVQYSILLDSLKAQRVGA